MLLISLYRAITLCYSRFYESNASYLYFYKDTKKVLNGAK